MRSSVLGSFGTFEEAVAEATRTTIVYRQKFGHLPNTDPTFRYVVRKRRTVWRDDWPRRRWNQGRHDRWLLLTGPDIPDRDTSNPTRRRT